MKAYYDRIYTGSQLDLDEKGNTFSKIAGLWQETKSQMHVLDIGCGAGSVSEVLVQRGHLVYGLDLMDEAVRRATQRGLIAQVYDVNQGLPFQDKYFDCVLALDIIEHLFDPLAALTEIHRVLTDRGYLLLFLPLHFDIYQRWRTLLGKGIVSYEHIYYNRANTAWNYFHIRFFTIPEAFDTFKLAGFISDGKPDYRPMMLPDLPRPLRKVISLHRLKKWANWWPTLFASGMLVRLHKVIS